jgi:hypothetical protein
MALTTTRSRGARTTAAPTPAATTAHRAWERPVGIGFTGLLALLVGAWGAVAPYVGPYFGFRPTAHDPWVTSLDNGLLHLVPGAVAAAAGLMLLGMGPARRSVRGGAFTLPAVMLLAAGAWFVIGPIAWPTFESGAPFAVGVSATRNLLNVACSSFAVGLVLVMLGGMALKAASVPAVPVEDPYTPAEAGAAPAVTPVEDRRAGSAQTVGTQPLAGGAAADRGLSGVEDRRAMREQDVAGGAPTQATADEMAPTEERRI